VAPVAPMISPFIIINLLLEFRKYDLPFPLLCDTELKLVQELGVYGEKKMAGRTYMGVYRTTFITDTEGTVTRIIGPKEVKVRAHAEQIL